MLYTVWSVSSVVEAALQAISWEDLSCISQLGTECSLSPGEFLLEMLLKTKKVRGCVD